MTISGWYQLDTGWDCGAVLFENNRMIACAPIFRKLLGQDYLSLYTKYRLTKIGIKEKDLSEEGR